MSTYINSLEVENLKRIKAVRITCSPTGLTVIGGKNGQGKTSVLDAICYALGGEKYKPSNAKRTDSVVDPEIKLTLSNGIIVERRGKNGTLKVIDPIKGKQGQALLSEFIHTFALDLPKFLHSSSKDKAQELLRIIGVGDKLLLLEQAHKRAYDDRHTHGQIADRKKKFALEMPYYSDAPDSTLSAGDLIREQQEIANHNGQNAMRIAQQVEIQESMRRCAGEVDRIRRLLAQEEEKLQDIARRKTALDAIIEKQSDRSAADIEAKISNIEEINSKVRANMDKVKAQEDADHHVATYDAMTAELKRIEAAKAALLDGANLPLPGLSVEDGNLTYNGQQWDCMSSSEQLRVATAIVRALNPKCGFVLIDQLEKMDLDTLGEFSEWLQSEGLQVIATRVSTGGECSIIIEDGIAEMDTPIETAKPAAAKPTFKAGEF